MKLTLYPHELIGEKVTITDASNKSLVGLQGRIIDETKETLKIESAKGLKVVFKKHLTFLLHSTQKTLFGEAIARRPEERIKGR